jgi:transcriptional regulator with XRE-family HTH domain
MRYEHASVEIDGAKLRRLRKEAGMTVKDLAAKVNVSFSYMAAVERGDRKTVAPARYIEICAALDITDRTELYARPVEVAA